MERAFTFSSYRKDRKRKKSETRKYFRYYIKKMERNGNYKTENYWTTTGWERRKEKAAIGKTKIKRRRENRKEKAAIDKTKIKRRANRKGKAAIDKTKIKRRKIGKEKEKEKNKTKKAKAPIKN